MATAELGDRWSPMSLRIQVKEEMCGSCRRKQLQSDALQMGALQCSHFRGQWANPKIMAETQKSSTESCQWAGGRPGLIIYTF